MTQASDDIIDCLPAVVCMFDADLGLVRWNRLLEEVTGHGPDALRGRRPEDFFEGQDKEMIRDASQAAMTRGHAAAEAPIVSAGGDRIPYHWAGTRLVVDGRAHLLATGLDIRARTEAEAALRETEQRLGHVIESMPLVLGSSEAGSNRTLLIAGDTESILGFEAERFYADPEFGPSRIHFEDQHRVREAFARGLAAGEPFEIEYRFMHGRTGLPIWIHQRVRPIPGPDGRPERFDSVAVDVTQRRQVEESLCESEERYRIVADFAHDWEYWQGPEGGILYMSPSCERITGYPPSAFMENPGLLVNIIHPEDAKAADKQLRHHLLESQDDCQLEFRIITRDGTVRWIAHRCAPAYRHGNAHAGRRVSHRDITDRKQAEARLKEGEERLRSMINAVTESAFLMDPQGIILACNRTFAERLGLGVEDLVGRDVFERLSGEVAVRRRTWVDAVVASRRPMRFEDQRDGRTLQHSMYPVIGEDGEVSSLAVFGSDVSGLRRAETEQTRWRSRLESLWGLAKLADADLKTLCDHVLAEIVNRTSSAYGFFGFLNDDASVMAIHAWSAQAMEACRVADKPLEYRIEAAGLWAEAVRRREPLIFNDCSQALAGSKGLPRGHVPIERLMVVPVFSKDRLVAVGAVANRLEPYEEADLEDLVGFLTNAELILDRKRHEQALNEAALRQQCAVKAANVGLWDWNLQTNEVVYSAEWKSQIGYAPDEIGNGFDEWHSRAHPDDLEPTLERIRASISDPDRPLQTEFRFRHKDGSYRWILALGAVLKDEAGRPARMLGTHVDITDLKRVEHERDRLTLAIEQSAEPIVITDAQATIQYVNPAFERITGYTREEVMGQNPRILKSGEQDDVFYRSMWDTLLRGETWSGRFVNRRKDGALYTEAATISPVRDPTGRTVAYVGVKRDISEFLRTQEQVRQLQKLTALGQISAGIAHDFNNLITVISAHAEQIRQQAPADRDVTSSLEIILQATGQAAAITRSLLTFGGQTRSTKEPLDLCQIVRQSAQMLRHTLPATVTLVEEIDPPIWINADATQLQQVLVNLLINARDAMPGGGRVLVSASQGASAAGRRVAILKVTDTGCGIAAEVRERLFEPFFTTKPRGQGTGLGLSIVHGIVTDHGGSITVESQPGRDTAFVMSFPALDAPPATPSQDESAPLRPARGETVLVAEDNWNVRSIISTTLTQCGMEVIEAASGDELMERFAEAAGRLRLLVLDIDLPGRSGLDCLRELRAGGVRTPALVITAAPGGPEEDDLDDRTVLLRKPFGVSDLQRLAARLITGHDEEEPDNE